MAKKKPTKKELNNYLAEHKDDLTILFQDKNYVLVSTTFPRSHGIMLLEAGFDVATSNTNARLLRIDIPKR